VFGRHIGTLGYFIDGLPLPGVEGHAGTLVVSEKLQGIVKIKFEVAVG
jgi:hypothetical protein